MKKIIDGIEITMTSEEVKERQAEEKTNWMALPLTQQIHQHLFIRRRLQAVMYLVLWDIRHITAQTQAVIQHIAQIKHYTRIATQHSIKFMQIHFILMAIFMLIFQMKD